MKHIKAISCLLLSSLVLTAFCGCDGSREESGVSDAMSGTYSVVSEAVSDVSAEEISMESFGEESGVSSGAEESSEEEPSGEESSEEEFSEEEYSGVELSEYVENAEDYTYIHYGEEGNGVCMCLQSTTEPTNTYVFRQSTRENRLLLSAILRQAIFRSATISRA